jgi:hypothetical protein
MLFILPEVFSDVRDELRGRAIDGERLIRAAWTLAEDNDDGEGLAAFHEGSQTSHPAKPV